MDPADVALNRAIGRIHGGELASVDYDVATCTFCAACNSVAPERENAHLESGLPRGRVMLAKGVLEGRAELTPRLHRHVAEAPLSHAPDMICPVDIPIARVTDLLLGSCVAEFGPLPEHAALAESVEKNGNVLGKPADARSKWAAFPWEPEARLVYFADDVASYETPDVAANAASVILNAGIPLHYLAKLERSSGATLIETGQREAARDVVVPMLEEMQKRGVDAVVSPDANAVRVMKLDWPLFAANEEDLKAPSALHSTTAIAQYLKQKRLEIGDEKFTKKVVYHPPEALTPTEREHGVEILKALGAEVIHADFCECGHGRALEKVNSGLAQTLAIDCLKAAEEAGAEVLVTANPGCQAALKGVAKKAKAKVEVMDLHVILAQHMKQREGGGVAAPAPTMEEEKPAEPEIGPDQYRVEFVKEGVVLAVDKNQTILEAGEEADMDLPSSCRAGSCDTCCAKWEGTAPEQSAAEALSGDQQKQFVLTCIAKPKGPIKIWSEEKP
jgi:ferredoxin